MAEAVLERQEIFQPQKKENIPFRKKIGNLARRVMQFVRRPVDISARPGFTTSKPMEKPRQLIDIERDLAEANKINPERAERISNEGCAVRAIMSAAAHATGETCLRARPQEWNARLHQMDQPPPRDEREAHEELLELYQGYRDGIYTDEGDESPLSKALKQVDVKLIPQPQHRKDIRELIKSKKQVMVIIDEFKGPKRIPHIFHIGLNEQGEFISLSDVKTINKQGKKVFETVSLPIIKKLTTFTVTPK